MQKLVQGVHKFQKDVFAAQRGLFERLADAQHPEALFITCSDSRVVPTILTQSEPGALFDYQNAGNLIPPYGARPGGSAAATIEYAVVALKVKDIVLCGHSHCGAIKALLDPESLADMPAMTAWLGHAEATRRIVRENYQHLADDPEKLYSAAIAEHVLVQLENLRTHPSVAAALARGSLHLHGWFYKFETGEVFAYDPEQGQFFPLADVRGAAEPRFRTRRGAAQGEAEGAP